jgi:acetylornithine deacetylase
MSPLEQRVLASLDVAGMVEAAGALIRIPSLGGAETPAQEFVAELLAARGFEVDRWVVPMDELEGHPAYSAEIERTDPLGVVGTLRGSGGGRDLILNGHVDVVPAGDPSLWTVPPFQGVVRDGSLFGRGALDMKGQLMAGLFALDAVRRAEITLAGSAHLMSVVGEEDGGMGTLAALERGYTADGAIVLEPTALAVAPAQAGCLNFRVRVVGRAAHGAVRAEGVSALEKLFPVFRALQALESRRNRRLAGDGLFAQYALPFPICVGTVHGGDWASSVPDHVMVEGRLGLSPEEDPQEARREMAEALAAVGEDDPWFQAHPARLEWWGGRYLAARTDPGDPLVRTVHSSAGEVLRTEVAVEGMTYGADMGLLSSLAGIPTVLFGAGDIRQAHRPDESVAIRELVELARVLALTVLRFCGVAGEGPGRAGPPT